MGARKSAQNQEKRHARAREKPHGLPNGYYKNEEYMNESHIGVERSNPTLIELNVARSSCRCGDFRARARADCGKAENKGTKVRTPPPTTPRDDDA